jgi:hypothetical protein
MHLVAPNPIIEHPMSYLPVVIIYILTFLGLMVFKFIQQPYSSAGISVRALESLTPILGGLALGLLLGLLLRIFQGDDKAPPLISTTTYSVVGLSIAYILHHLIT